MEESKLVRKSGFFGVIDSTLATAPLSTLNESPLETMDESPCAPQRARHEESVFLCKSDKVEEYTDGRTDWASKTRKHVKQTYKQTFKRNDWGIDLLLSRAERDESLGRV